MDRSDIQGMSSWTSPDAEKWRFVFQRLDNLEVELSELREATWPVCQGIREERGQKTLPEKRRFFKFLDFDIVQRLVRLKGEFKGRYPALDVEELRQVLVEEPRVAGG
jgi:hypothetical protein